MSTQRIVHWGLLGPGRIAHKFAADLSQVPGARLHAVASRSLDRAEAFAQQYGATHAFGRYEDLPACPDLDVIYVASPHAGHHEHALLCLEAGLGVLCEKPLAINHRQASEMVQVARGRGAFLMEAIWTRFLPAFEHASTLVAEGAIGTLHSIKADFGFPAPFDPAHRLFDPALGGGALLDIGLYPVFLALHFLGRPQSIRTLAQRSPTGVDEEIGVLFAYAGGQMAHLHASLRARTKTEAFLYGTEGTIHLHTRWHDTDRFTLLREDARPENFHFEMPGLGYYAEAMEVGRCLRDGRTESASLPLDFSLDLMATLDAIREAAGIRYPQDEAGVG